MLCSLPFLQVNLGIYVKDTGMELSVLVDGQVELMQNRLITFLIYSYLLISYIIYHIIVKIDWNYVGI